MSDLWKAFRVALGFLTIVPMGTIRGEVTPADLARSRFFYPVVGLLIGGLLGLVSLTLSRFEAGNGPSAWVLVVVGVVLTGGLHLDGLADTFDGLFLHGGAERRLAVMRDPHVGSFGVAAMVLVTLGKIELLSGLGANRRAQAVLGAAAIGRTLLLLAAGSARYARPEGTGRAVIDASSWGDALFAGIFAPLLGWVACGRRGLLGGLVASLVALSLARLSKRRIEGITGDILGAVVELGEVAFLLTV